MTDKFSYRKRKETFFKALCLALTFVSIIILIILLYHIAIAGNKYISLKFLTSWPSRFPHKAGIKAGIWGTLWLISLTALISVPIGIFSSLFLEEYKIPGKIGKIIEINVANLAGVPSIVYGLLGLTVFVRYLGLDRSLLSGALTLSLLILPVIIVSSREAIKAVPDSIRYAAYALGASKYQVILWHVLPSAIPGILTGVILALSRAIGETAPLIIVGALTYVSYTPESIMDEFTVLPLQIYNWASRPQEEFHSLAAAGIIVLLSVMMTMNLIAVIIRQKASKKVKV
jgi:phosphate transport system permease protein